MTDTYDDIIHLPHPASPTHPRMSVSARTTQFSQYATLTGYGNAVKETARLTNQKLELEEDRKAAINEMLMLIQAQIEHKLQVAITYFKPDDKKDGGTYITTYGRVEYWMVTHMLRNKGIYISHKRVG
ncbi:hypothetical protein NXG27_07310 [Megasphaera paucivorans]|uniref:Uncharacterized protein n=1 Tax=Megasphaera paucivorans TaxID=349095 RepID=A0A1G9WZ97_9FIRM|nr:hypothetical protein [Megasphaera paucivorans]SDM89779.1 hypothetical protein SAMN05660299_01720 [Megasphaera paucivorans]